MLRSSSSLFLKMNTDIAIVMTPKKPKVSQSTRLKIERKSIASPAITTAKASTNGDTPTTKMHVAGGSYAGIVINKQQDIDEKGL